MRRSEGFDDVPVDPATLRAEDQLGLDQAGVLARRAVVESAIRDCMKAQGFDQTCEDCHVTPVERVVRGEYEAAFRRDDGALLSSIRPAGG